jgi:hypothetical protein
MTTESQILPTLLHSDHLTIQPWAWEMSKDEMVEW